MCTNGYQSCQNTVNMSILSNMGYNFLGKSGLKVSNICLGTMTFGILKGSLAVFECSTQLDEEKSYQILDRYVELGGNFLDTANIYARGKSEEIIGNWLEKQKRDRIVVATKCHFQMDASDVNKAGLSRRHIVQSVEENLARLKTNYIDILQAHAWDIAVPIEETLRTFNDLVRYGKIRYYGFSNVCGWQLQKIFDFAKYNGLNQPISLQNSLEKGYLPIELHSTDQSGLLNGKFQQGETPDKPQIRIGFVHTDEKQALQSAQHGVITLRTRPTGTL